MLKDEKEKKPIKIGTLFDAESETKLVKSSVPQSGCGRKERGSWRFGECLNIVMQRGLLGKPQCYF